MTTLKRRVIASTLGASVVAGIGAATRSDLSSADLHGLTDAGAQHLLLTTLVLLALVLAVGDLSFHIVRKTPDGSTRTSFVLSLGRRWRRNAADWTALDDASPDTSSAATSTRAQLEPVAPDVDTHPTPSAARDASHLIESQLGTPPYWIGYQAAYREMHAEHQAAADLALLRSSSDPNQLPLPDSASWRLDQPGNRHGWSNAANL